MANQPETGNYDAGVYQWELADAVRGGAGGLANAPILNLANRTAWLKGQVTALGTSITTVAGNLAAAKAEADSDTANINAVVAAAGLAPNISNAGLLLQALQDMFRAKGTPLNLAAVADIIGTLPFGNMGPFPISAGGSANIVVLPGNIILQTIIATSKTGYVDVFYWPTAFPHGCIGAVTTEGAAGGWQAGCAPTIHGVSNLQPSFYQHSSASWTGNGWAYTPLSFVTVAIGY